MIADVDGDRSGDFIGLAGVDRHFFWLTSSSGYATADQRQWGSGALGDKPLVGDFDGDGRSDLAVWRASTGTWYWLTAASGYSYSLRRQPPVGQRRRRRRAEGRPTSTAMARTICWCGERPTGVWYWLTSSSGYSYASSGMRQWGSQGPRRPCRWSATSMATTAPGSRRSAARAAACGTGCTAASGYSTRGVRAMGQSGRFRSSRRSSSTNGTRPPTRARRPPRRPPRRPRHPRRRRPAPAPTPSAHGAARAAVEHPSRRLRHRRRLQHRSRRDVGRRR